MKWRVVVTRPMGRRSAVMASSYSRRPGPADGRAASPSLTTPWSARPLRRTSIESRSRRGGDDDVPLGQIVRRHHLAVDQAGDRGPGRHQAQAQPGQAGHRRGDHHPAEAAHPQARQPGPPAPRRARPPPRSSPSRRSDDVSSRLVNPQRRRRSGQRPPRRRPRRGAASKRGPVALVPVNGGWPATATVASPTLSTVVHPHRERKADTLAPRLPSRRCDQPTSPASSPPARRPCHPTDPWSPSSSPGSTSLPTDTAARSGSPRAGADAASPPDRRREGRRLAGLVARRHNGGLHVPPRGQGRGDDAAPPPGRRPG